MLTKKLHQTKQAGLILGNNLSLWADLIWIIEVELLDIKKTQSERVILIILWVSRCYYIVTWHKGLVPVFYC